MEEYETGPQFTNYRGKGNLDRIRVPELSYEHGCAHYPVSYVKKIVDNITSDDAMFCVCDDGVMEIEWKDEDGSWRAFIAPRIENR